MAMSTVYLCAISVLTSYMTRSFCNDLHSGKPAIATQPAMETKSIWPPLPWWNKYPVGDPKFCFFFHDVNTLEVLPGFGWDNLLNIEMGQVLATNYSQCKTTADRKYLLPDNAFVIPVKRSKVDMSSEVFDRWNSYTSTTAHSVNLHASYSVVSGSFAEDFKYNKEKQVGDKAVTTRVQLRHFMYMVKTHPESSLHPAFKSRLMQIAAELQNNRTKQAWYSAQLLVREYGTHIITSVDAGAALVQETHIKENVLKDKSLSAHDLKVAATATFFRSLKFGAGFGHNVSNENVHKFEKSRTASRVLTYGGPPYRSKFSVQNWEDSLTNELVAIDRSGDPLYYVINSATLPSLPEPTVFRLAKIVQRAARLYYKVNTVAGCTEETSPRFNFDANVNDGSCHATQTNFTFGGVYQKCYASRFNSAGNLCDELQHKNPLTGDFSCPEGYEAVELLKPQSGERPVVTKSYHHTHCRKLCRPCGFFLLQDCCHTSCQNIFHYSMVYIAPYWCAAAMTVGENSGMLFGGVYISHDPNPVTGAQSCPHRFYALPFGSHSHVCVSDDYELGYQFSLRFGGFFSCSSGNPLAVPNKNHQQKSGKTTPKTSPKRNLAGIVNGPQSCPRGYTQHFLSVDNECEINYCVKANSLAKLSRTAVRRPPYNARPGVSPKATKTLMVVGINGEVWYRNNSNADWTLASFATQDDDDSSEEMVSEDQTKPMSQGAAIALSVCATVLAGILAVAVYVSYKRREKTKEYRAVSLKEVLLPDEKTPLNNNNTSEIS